MPTATITHLLIRSLPNAPLCLQEMAARAGGTPNKQLDLLNQVNWSGHAILSSGVHQLCSDSCSATAACCPKTTRAQALCTTCTLKARGLHASRPQQVF